MNCASTPPSIVPPVVAGVQRDVAADVADDVIDVEDQVGGAFALADLAVEAHLDVQVVVVESGDEHGANGAECVGTLRTQPLQIVALPVALGDVVACGNAEDVLVRVLFRHVARRLADHHTELDLLGIESSPAFVREPEGNGCVERFIRTLKENLLWVRRFDTIEELRQALLAFKETYNHAWIVERHGYQTPAAVRAAQPAPLPVAA